MAAGTRGDEVLDRCRHGKSAGQHCDRCDGALDLRDEVTEEDLAYGLTDDDADLGIATDETRP